MSKAYALRQALKDSIVEADIGLAAEDIIIERQGDIITEIENAVSHASNGVTLTIGQATKTNIARKTERPRWESELSLRLWVQPVLQDGNRPEEDISEELENHLQGLVLDTSKPEALQALEAIELIRGSEVPDPEYLVRELVIKTIIQN